MEYKELEGQAAGKMKRNLVIAVVVLVILAAVIVPTALWLSNMSNDAAMEEALRLRIEFVERYGAEALLTDLYEPENFYIYVWELESVRHFTLYIDGLFVELGQVELE